MVLVPVEELPKSGYPPPVQKEKHKKVKKWSDKFQNRVEIQIQIRRERDGLVYLPVWLLLITSKNKMNGFSFSYFENIGYYWEYRNILYSSDPFLV